jgi:ribonuclease Z
MELIFLGTGCMSPTKERNHQAIFLKYNEEGLLFDCGEGTQRQFMTAGIKIPKITKIFISHWHGDHVLGLPGLLQTLNNSEYSGKLFIFGPAGTKKKIKQLNEVYFFEMAVEYEIVEISEGRIYDANDYYIEAVKLDHSIETFGYSFIEKDRRKIKLPYIKARGIPDGPVLGKLQDGKDATWKGTTILADEATYIIKGKKVSFIMDTSLSRGCDLLAKDADVLICESVYTSAFSEKAKEYKHMTAQQAGMLASRNDVKQLILTHFSQRFKTTEDMCKEAKTYFDNVSCAYDFMKTKI